MTRSIRSLFVTCAWALTFWLLSRHGMRLLPLGLTRQLSYQGYLSLIQLVTLGFGLLLTALLLGNPSAALGWQRPRVFNLYAIALLTPAIFVIVSYLAIAASIPLLLEELRAGGRELAQRSTGEFGVQLTQAPAFLTLLWGAVLSPLGEECFFRGMLWGTLQSLVGGSPGEKPTDGGGDQAWLQPTATSRAWLWLRSGGIATLLSALAFGALHADMSGGLGRVRFCSALGLGLACGLARQHTRSLAAALLLHAIFNVFSIATARRWLATESFPIRLGVPTLASLIAVACIVLLAMSLFARQRLTPRPE